LWDTFVASSFVDLSDDEASLSGARRVRVPVSVSCELLHKSSSSSALQSVQCLQLDALPSAQRLAWLPLLRSVPQLQTLLIDYAADAAQVSALARCLSEAHDSKSLTRLQ
jgi:hypothetical protein